MRYGLHGWKGKCSVSAMATRLPQDPDIARNVDRLEERTALLRERFGDLRGEMIRGHESLANGRASLREKMVRGQESLREEMLRRYEALREDMIRGNSALEARIDKLDAKMTFFFGALLVTILAQMALQFLR